MDMNGWRLQGAGCRPRRNLKALSGLLPQTAPEILFWIATSITAGVAEKIAGRGYVQQPCREVS